METIKELAAQYLKEGNNCAETVSKVSNDMMDLHMNDEMFRMMSVLGGGVGGSGDICGALNSACLILGLLVGRANPGEKTKPEMNGPVHEFYQLWMNRFGSSDCRVLKSPANGGPVSCPELMTVTAEMLAQFIKEKGLLA
ncbi:C-GCAxxG-C-C family protein [uncultured Megasphaera sp.]|uniref:C-GCAxxG-C-C family protein n=1 Tax=uncultured Megasphaera sp. TaxID=165188 RepID=UPI002657DBE5|nr:C-GCAxxG-C-C family protein [uncultured Megasphaera sp.]